MKNLSPKLILTYIGMDCFDRPAYECDEVMYVDTDPRSYRTPMICTKLYNDFNGEPDVPIKENIELEFVPKRIIWY